MDTILLSGSSSNNSRPCRRGTSEHAPLQLVSAVTTPLASKLPTSTFHLRVSPAGEGTDCLSPTIWPWAAYSRIQGEDAFLLEETKHIQAQHSPSPHPATAERRLAQASDLRARPSSQEMPLPQQPRTQYCTPSHAHAQLESSTRTKFARHAVSDPSHQALLQLQQTSADSPGPVSARRCRPSPPRTGHTR